jgi:poly-gamma-glutamate synthesis protein (capsule biosynthesis protein)
MLILFVFGSYMKDMQSNVMHVSVTDLSYDPRTIYIEKDSNQTLFGGIVPETTKFYGDLVEYFAKIKEIEAPDTIIVIAKSNKTSQKAPVVTHRLVYDSPYGDIFYDNFFIDNLIKKDFVSIDNSFFEEPGNVATFISYVPYVFDEDVQVVPIFITDDAEKINIYHLSRTLRTLVNKRNKDTVVIGLSDWSSAELSHVRDLHDTTTKRALENFEIPKVNRLKIGSPEVVKTILYYCMFQRADLVNSVDQAGEKYIYFQKAEDESATQASSDGKDEVTLLAFGDVMLDRSVRALMNSNGLYYPFEKIAGEDDNFMAGVDFVFANLEGPIKEVYVPTSKSIAFRFLPDITTVLNRAGINIVSIANNHALDQGWGGRDDTMKFLGEAGIAYFGHPKNEREGNTYTTKIDDTSVAFAGFDDTIFKIDYEKISAYIKDLDSKNDYVIVSVHWGREYIHTPTKRKVELAHMFVDSGADLVLGHHPHVVQTMEIYNGVPVFYSLGNFVFDQYFSQATQEGLAVGAVLEEGKKTVYLFPYKIPKSQPELMNYDEKQEFLEKFIGWGDYSDEVKNSIREGKIVVTDS